MKTCNRCKETKDYSDFDKDKSKKDGVHTICKKCQKEYRSTEKFKARLRKYKMEEHRRDPRILMLGLAKNRAKKKGLPFNIKLDDIIVPEFCPILGIKLKVNDRKMGKDSPTLDRIIPEQGYVLGNIQVISGMANTMKSDASIAELIKFAKWVISGFDK